MKAPRSLPVLAAEVQAHLEGQGFSVVLVGGSAATAYSKEAYQSRDIDFVFEKDVINASKLIEAMRQMGFAAVSNGVFVNPKEKYTIDLISGPLLLDNEAMSPPVRIQVGKNELKIISPTDCVRDRLLWFYHYNDRAGLAQAVLVAQAQADQIDIDMIRAWSKKIKKDEEFAEFHRLVLSS
ncbi:MAG: hypothetical protein KDC26_01350 [Armatimonadetes bacterium]|nr:hypothetical protein [Armatimonadota bacterium]